jgi:hypothetical protein
MSAAAGPPRHLAPAELEPGYASVEAESGPMRVTLRVTGSPSSEALALALHAALRAAAGVLSALGELERER